MSNTWKDRFKQLHDRITINKPSLGKSNITADWYRAATEKPSKIYIDGKPLSHYVDNKTLVCGNEAITKENLNNFFENVILGKLPISILKDEMVEYLMTSFHQGGLLYPVTGAINTELEKMAFEEQLNNAANILYQCAKLLPETKDAICNNLKLPKNDMPTKEAIKESILNQLGPEQNPAKFMPFMSQMNKAINSSKVNLSQQFLDSKRTVPTNTKYGIVNIVTTKTGFKCQEFVSLDSMLLPNATHMQGDGGKSVLKAQGTIDVDFSNFDAVHGKPTINVENNTISFGNSDLQQKFDKRNILDILIDFLKNLVGSNVVESITPEEPVNTTIEENTTNFIAPKS